MMLVEGVSNNIVWGQMVIRLSIVIISLYMQMPNHFVPHLSHTIYYTLVG